VAAAFQDPPTLGERVGEHRHVVQDLATPHEVRALCFERDVLGVSLVETDPSAHVVVFRGQGLLRELDVATHGIDTEHGKAESPRQLQRVFALTASEVDGGCATRQPEPGDHVVKEIRTARVQTDTQRRLELLFDPRVVVVVLVEREPTLRLIRHRAPGR
jgi:hypothetical protein